MSSESFGKVDAEPMHYPWILNEEPIFDFEDVDAKDDFKHETSAAAAVAIFHNVDAGTVDVQPIDDYGTSDVEIVCDAELDYERVSDTECICNADSIDDSHSVTSDVDSETSDDESTDNSITAALARLHDYEIPNLESMYIPSIPYEDPRAFDARRYRHIKYYPHGVKYDNAPKPHAPDSEYKPFLKDAGVSNRDGTVFRNQTGSYYLATGLFHRLVQEGKIRKVPSLIQAMLATKKTKLLPDQCLRVSQNGEFVPLWGGPSSGPYGIKDEGTFLYIADDNSIHYPVVYFVSYLGFVVSCVRSWMKQKTAVKYLNAGTGDVIGFRSFKNKANRTVCRWLVVNFKLLRAAPNAENYRYVNLSDEDCSNRRYLSAVAGLLAAAYFGARPTTLHIVHHIKDRFNNNLKLLKWLTHQENMLKENITAGYDLSQRASTVTLEIKYKDCSNKEIWIPHPFLAIKINVKGDHLYCIESGCCIPITVITYKLWNENAKVPLVKVVVSFGGKTYIFYRLVLECKLQDLLTDKEFVDHRDRDRTNNAMTNLLAVSSLESANNKSTMTAYRENGDMRGVYYKKGEFFMVQYSDFKIFQIPRKATYGGPENAERRAKLFREAKMEENAQFRKKYSLQHRGRSEDGKPLVPIHGPGLNNAPKQKRPRLPVLNSEEQEERDREKSLLNNQRSRLNKARKNEGMDTLTKNYTVDECARFPGFKHYAEPYLLRSAPPTEHENILNEYRRLKLEYGTSVDTGDQDTTKENVEANRDNGHGSRIPAALLVKPQKLGKGTRIGDPNPIQTKAKLAKAVEALRTNPNLSELDALRQSGFDYADGATQSDTDSDNVKLLYRTRALRRRLETDSLETDTEVKLANAVEALRDDPSLSELDALRQSGFNYPDGAIKSDTDDVGVKLEYRKRALKRRLDAAMEPRKQKLSR